MTEIIQAKFKQKCQAKIRKMKMSDNNSSEKYPKSNHVDFTAVQGNDVEEGSTDDEGEDGLDLFNVFDDVPQYTDAIIDTIYALDQHLFTPVTPSPIPEMSTTKEKQIENSVGDIVNHFMAQPNEKFTYHIIKLWIMNLN